MIIRQLFTGLLGIWILGTNTVLSFYSPQHVMVDVTNDFGVCVLQFISSKKENVAFSPYGLVSVALVLYEGSTGPSAAEIHNTLRLPWDREVTRVGFRDMHRYLKSYFSNDGFLRGLVLSKPNIMLRKNYTDLLQFYGFDVRTSPSNILTTPVPPVLTTTKPVIFPPKTATTKPPRTTTTESGKTTVTKPSTGTPDLDSRFGTTTTETPKQQTTMTTMKGPETTLVTQTSTPVFKTTAEKTTKAVVTAPPTTTKSPVRTTTRSPPQTTTRPLTTTAPPTKPSTTRPPQTTTTKPPTTTPQPTSTMPTTTKPPPTPTTARTTKAEPPTTTPPPTTTTKPPTTKSADSTQSGTTLDVVTMTDKKPNTPEIMSQVNMSATAMPGIMEGRDGDSEMDLETTKPETPTTSKPTTVEKITTTEALTTQAITLQTTEAVEVSIAETTVSKSVSMVDPNTTPIPSTLHQETTAPPRKSETNPITLIIETTTQPPTMSDATAEASESVSQGTTMMLPEDTTILPEGNVNLNGEGEADETNTTATTPRVIQVTTESPPLSPGGFPPVVTTGPPTGVGTEAATPATVVTAAPPIGGVTVTLPADQPPVTVIPVTETTLSDPPSTVTINVPPAIAVATETVPPVPLATGTPIPTATATGVLTELPTQPAAILPQNPMALQERMDTEASESQNAEFLARQQRSLFSTHKTPEYHKSGSNWVPRYQDHRWGQNPSNEFWFFTFDGGENVPAHTYTAYLPFAFVPELSSLAIQLPLDDPRYSILILLPEERLGLSQLLYSLQWCPVRAILTHLKTTAVYAVVPAFTIVKHINLVPALAKMGIHSAFDPFRADLSPMTTEPHLFVRTIEQVVTVSLRKYYPSNRWFEASPNEVRQHFVANHPFAYFVLDKETDVTLMAGTIVNPVAHNQ